MITDSEAGQSTGLSPNVPSRFLRTENEIFQAGIADTKALGEHPSPKQAARIAELLRPHADQLQARDSGPQGTS